MVVKGVKQGCIVSGGSFRASPSALIRLSISDFSMMKGGASWMVSPP
jgi:hypothetical protein